MSHPQVDEIVEETTKAMPSLDATEQRIAVAVYETLAEGDASPPSHLEDRRSMSESTSSKSVVGAAAAGAGAAALATAAGACCLPIVAPLVVAVLGASGAAWAAGLKPYSLVILGFAALLLAYGYWMVYRPRPELAGEACPVQRPLSPRLVLWLATALWAVAAVLNLAPQLSSYLL